MRRSVVGVFHNGYLTDPRFKLDNNNEVDFAMIYEASHEILHAWAQPYISNSNESSSALAHNSYITGSNSYSNSFLFISTLHLSNLPILEMQ